MISVGSTRHHIIWAQGTHKCGMALPNHDRGRGDGMLKKLVGWTSLAGSQEQGACWTSTPGNSKPPHMRADSRNWNGNN